MIPSGWTCRKYASAEDIPARAHTACRRPKVSQSYDEERLFYWIGSPIVVFGSEGNDAHIFIDRRWGLLEGHGRMCLMLVVLAI